MQPAFPNLPEIDPRVQLAAARKLQRMVNQARNSFEIRSYRKHRAAALKATRRHLASG